MAMVYPVKEWFLMYGANEGYQCELKDYKTNVKTHLKNYRFERGDVPEVIISSNIKNPGYVSINDTIATIKSYYIDNEISRLKNLAEVEKATLNVQKAGEKEALIEHANEKYLYANQQLELEEKNYKRQKELFDDGIIPESEYEVYENTFKLAQINTQIAYDEFLAISTGQKQEEIDLANERINSIENELEKLKILKDQYYILTPVNGIVSFTNQLDVVLKVADTTEFILEIPVRLNNIKYLSNLSSIKFSTPGFEFESVAQFMHTETNVNYVSNQQAIIAKALVPGNIPGVRAGMLVKCSVVCDKITIFEYLKRGLQN